MSSKVVRVALLLAALGSLAASGYVIFDSEQALRAQQAAKTAFDAETEAARVDLARLRSAEQAYVAEGQSADYWMGQAADALGKVDRELAALASDVSADGTRSAIQASSGVLEDFRKLDQRARQYMKSGQMLMASDVIFTDGLTAITTVADHLSTARSNEASVHDAAIDALRWREIYAAGGAALLLTLAVLLLAPVPEREVDLLTAMRALTEPTAAQLPKARIESAALPIIPAQPPGSVANLDDVPDIDAVRSAGGWTAPVAPAAFAPAPSEIASAPKASASAADASTADKPVLDLTGAAKVCADMARVLDASDLPGLLLRLANVLSAPGLIVWVADRSGQVLYPLLTHGYSAASVVRIGSIPTAAENATALAWRTGQAGVITGESGGLGALVAPIVTAEGCVGVLAAEVPDGAESRAEIQALATIFAAQLATFVTALPATGGQSLVAEA
jgi:hypothetical protein